MANPKDDGKYGDNEHKHDCPRPLAGCRYPKCNCDVDFDERSNKEFSEDPKNYD